jgi:aminodeoxyfutalosine deaminase
VGGSNLLKISCRFLVVDSNRIIANAQIVVGEGRIVELNELPATGSDLVLPETVLLPGLINAHTHLEFSDLRRPIDAGTSFPDWISRVVRHRLQLAGELNEAGLQAHRRHAVTRGLWEAGATGTALLVDTVTNPWQPEWLAADQIRRSLKELSGQGDPAQAGLLEKGAIDSLQDLRMPPMEIIPRVIPLMEILGMDPDRLRQSVGWAEASIQNAAIIKDSTFINELGFSPHSPYTLPCTETFDWLKRFPETAIAAMHVAESRDELQWLSQAEGPFQSLFDSMKVSNYSRRMPIDEAVEWLCSRQRSLLVHGNYLTPLQLDRLAAASVGIVYCPRTHQHFGHDDYPLSAIRRRQIPLLLGTDSRASSPDLNLWLECKAARQRHPDWPINDLLDSVTRTAAAVLGADRDLGSLDVGKVAWLNAIPCPPEATSDNLLELLFSSVNSDQPRPFLLPGFKHG